MLNPEIEVLAEQSTGLAELCRKPSLETIQRFEHQLRALPQIDIETTHHFAEGLYGREIFIPAGTVLTGKVHRGEHLNFLMKGDITVWTDEGMKRLKAPAIIKSRPGTKRVGYAHEDTIWVTVHASRETDLEKLEAELIVPEDHRIEQEAPCPGLP